MKYSAYHTINLLCALLGIVSGVLWWFFEMSKPFELVFWLSMLGTATNDGVKKYKEYNRYN